jgi:hypothetical protein
MHWERLEKRINAVLPVGLKYSERTGCLASWRPKAVGLWHRELNMMKTGVFDLEGEYSNKQDI